MIRCVLANFNHPDLRISTPSSSTAGALPPCSYPSYSLTHRHEIVQETKSVTKDPWPEPSTNLNTWNMNSARKYKWTQPAYHAYTVITSIIFFRIDLLVDASTPEKMFILSYRTAKTSTCTMRKLDKRRQNKEYESRILGPQSFAASQWRLLNASRNSKQTNPRSSNILVMCDNFNTCFQIKEAWAAWCISRTDLSLYSRAL